MKPNFSRQGKIESAFMQREEEARIARLYGFKLYVDDCYFFGVPFKLASPSQIGKTPFLIASIPPDSYQFRAT